MWNSEELSLETLQSFSRNSSEISLIFFAKFLSKPTRNLGRPTKTSPNPKSRKELKNYCQKLNRNLGKSFAFAVPLYQLILFRINHFFNYLHVKWECYKKIWEQNSATWGSPTTRRVNTSTFFKRRSCILAGYLELCKYEQNRQKWNGISHIVIRISDNKI